MLPSSTRRKCAFWFDILWGINKMKRLSSSVLYFAALGLVFLGLTVAVDAQKRNEREVRDLVRNLNAQIDDFQYGLDYELDNNGGNRSSSVDRSLNDVKEALNIFQGNFQRKRENDADVNGIVSAAQRVESDIRSIAVNRKLQTDWNAIKSNINKLGSNYGVIPRWNGAISNTSSNSPDDYDNDQPVSAPTNFSDSPLTGTYALDVNRSEKIADIISGTNASGANRQDLQSKLEAPEQVALDVRGNRVTLATSNAAPVTIFADGSEKTENINGRSVRLKATMRGNELTVSSLGGQTDYTIVFSSQDGGRTMKVTRRITTDYLSETVFAESFYTKGNDVAGLGIEPNNDNTGVYSSNDPNDAPTTTGGTQPTISRPRVGEFIVPDGVVITANLDHLIDTKVSQNNDRFKATVQSPNEFRGATVEGYLSGVGRSGRISGRSNITFNFESITLRDGKRYDFGGTLQGVKDVNGKEVKVDTEGTARGGSQTNETAKRGGIGAGIGALIGAIAGGAKGAVIGAAIGGGAGAGSVYATGRDDLKLEQNSTLSIQSSSPIRRDSQLSEN